MRSTKTLLVLLSVQVIQCASKTAANTDESIVHKGAPRGMCNTHKDKVKQELLAFIKAQRHKREQHMILQIYTIIHTLISLVGIFTGFVVLFGLLAAKRLDGWTKWFLITTVLTSVTGFGFPVHHFTPSHGVGIISLLVLAVAIYARCRRELAGAWRWIYVVGAMMAL